MVIHFSSSSRRHSESVSRYLRSSKGRIPAQVRLQEYAVRVPFQRNSNSRSPEPSQSSFLKAGDSFL